MALVESDSVLKKIYFSYIQEPLLKIKERWLAYFAKFAIDDEPSISDVEIQIPSGQALPPKQEDVESFPTGGRELKQPQLKLSRIAFFSNAMAATFGLGHQWRFPSLAYKYGGGAFLIIYAVSTLLLGYSLHFAEVALGQYSSKNTLRIFERVPLMQGVGYSIVAYGYILSTYYSHVVAFSMYYFATSFQYDLPWTRCPPVESYSNETMCFTVINPAKPYEMELKCPSGVIVFDSQRICKDSKYASSMRDMCCPKGTKECKEFTRKSLCRRRQPPAAYYWTTHIVRYDPVESAKRWILGIPDLKLLLCTVAAWFLIYAIVSAGVKWTGITSMAIIPSMVVAYLFMLMVALNIKGALNGITRFFVPKLEDFTKHEIWYAAMSHSFFSLGIAAGPGFTLGSLSRFRNPCYLDTLFVSIAAVLASVLSGSIVYCMIGYIESYTGLDFEIAINKGTGTAIVAYSDILGKFPVAWLSSSIFFFLLTSATAISVSYVVISTSSSISEVFKVFHKDRYMINFLLVFTSFLLSVTMTLNEGLILFSCLDNFTMRLILPIICIFEVLSLLMYGLNLVSEDISFMIGSYPSFFFKPIWVLCPFAILAALIYRNLELEVTHWLRWTKITELAVAVLLLIPTIYFMFINFIRYSFSKTPKHMLRLPSRCEPNSEELKALRMNFKI